MHMHALCEVFSCRFTQAYPGQGHGKPKLGYQGQRHNKSGLMDSKHDHEGTQQHAEIGGRRQDALAAPSHSKPYHNPTVPVSLQFGKKYLWYTCTLPLCKCG